MEISSAGWISEWEIEDPPPFMNEFKIDPFDFSFDEFKFEENSFYESAVPPCAVAERQAEQLKVAEEGRGIKYKKIGGNYKGESSSSSSHIISFEKSNKGSVEAKSEMGFESVSYISESWNNNNNNNNNNNEKNWKRCSNSMNRNPLHAREHVIAERKRREKLSQRFIALSALIPGLNKVDKASILGGAIRHVKELQERLKVVEEQATPKMSESQSAVYVKRTSLQVSPSSSSDTSSSEENSFSGGPTPEIEARFLNKDVLIRIHCHKRKGCLSYLLNKVENFNNLTILNSCALPFGHSKLDITIVAQVDVGFCMTVEDVVKNLRQALLDFN